MSISENRGLIFPAFNAFAKAVVQVFGNALAWYR